MSVSVVRWVGGGGKGWVDGEPVSVVEQYLAASYHSAIVRWSFLLLTPLTPPISFLFVSLSRYDGRRYGTALYEATWFFATSTGDESSPLPTPPTPTTALHPQTPSLQETTR